MPRGSIRFDSNKFCTARSLLFQSQEELAEAADVDLKAVKRAESGKPVSLANAKKIVTALKCKIEYLLPDLPRIITQPVGAKNPAAAENQAQVNVTWEEVTSGALTICRKIIKPPWTDKKIDIVVSAGRSAAILGAMLAGNLLHKPFYVIDLCYQPDAQPVFHGEIDFAGFPNVLLVLPSPDIERILSEAKIHLKKRNAKKLYSCALFIPQSMSGQVDFHAYMYDPQCDLRFPWQLVL